MSVKRNEFERKIAVARKSLAAAESAGGADVNPRFDALLKCIDDGVAPVCVSIDELADDIKASSAGSVRPLKSLVAFKAMIVADELPSIESRDALYADVTRRIARVYENRVNKAERAVTDAVQAVADAELAYNTAMRAFVDAAANGTSGADGVPSADDIVTLRKAIDTARKVVPERQAAVPVARSAYEFRRKIAEAAAAVAAISASVAVNNRAAELMREWKAAQAQAQ